jgi:hypothetical protein
VWPLGTVLFYWNPWLPLRARRRQRGRECRCGDEAKAMKGSRDRALTTEPRDCGRLEKLALAIVACRAMPSWRVMQPWSSRQRGIVMSDGDGLLVSRDLILILTGGGRRTVRLTPRVAMSAMGR